MWKSPLILYNANKVLHICVDPRFFKSVVYIDGWIDNRPIDGQTECVFVCVCVSA